MFGFGKKKAKKEEVKVEAKEAVEVKTEANSMPAMAVEMAKKAEENGAKVVYCTHEHKHDEKCNHPHDVVSMDKEAKETKEEHQEPPPLTFREMKALKRAKYDPVKSPFKQSFLLGNNKTGQVAEIRAASSVHACNIIGWRPNKVTLLETRIIEDATAESVSQSDVKVVPDEVPPGLK